MEITREVLRKKGFHEYEPYGNDHAIKCYEKEYILPDGSVYFLSVKEYLSTDRFDRLFCKPYFEGYAKLFKMGTHEEIKLYFDFKNLDDVVAFIDKLFEMKLVESCRAVY